MRATVSVSSLAEHDRSGLREAERKLGGQGLVGEAPDPVRAEKPWHMRCRQF